MRKKEKKKRSSRNEFFVTYRDCIEFIGTSLRSFNIIVQPQISYRKVDIGIDLCPPLALIHKSAKRKIRTIQKIKTNDSKTDVGVCNTADLLIILL